MENWVVYNRTAMHKSHPWLVVLKTEFQGQILVTIPPPILERFEREIGREHIQEYLNSAREVFLESFFDDEFKLT